jgi:hypothetical protein
MKLRRFFWVGLATALAAIALVAVIAFELTHLFSTIDLSGSETAVTAPLGDLLTHPAASIRISNATQPGAVREPGILNSRPAERDRSTQWFQTFLSATRIADEIQNPATEETTLTAAFTAFVPTESALKSDAWGNAFCVSQIDSRVAVASLGRAATKETTCALVGVSRTDLLALRPNALYEYPSGSLVLVRDTNTHGKR